MSSTDRVRFSAWKKEHLADAFPARIGRNVRVPHVEKLLTQLVFLDISQFRLGNFRTHIEDEYDFSQ